MKKFIAILALGVALHANAKPPQVSEGVCYALANFARTTATLRDAGLPEAEAGAIVIENLQDRSKLSSFLLVVHAVYGGSESPKELSDLMLKTCLPN